MLSPIILVLCVVGTYALHNNMADVWIMLVCGLIGYKMKAYGFAAAPIVLGLVLGELIEVSLRRSLIVFDNNPFVFFTRPWSLAFIILTVLGLCSPANQVLDRKSRTKNKERIEFFMNISSPVIAWGWRFATIFRGVVCESHRGSS